MPVLTADTLVILECSLTCAPVIALMLLKCLKVYAKQKVRLTMMRQHHNTMI